MSSRQQSCLTGRWLHAVFVAVLLLALAGPRSARVAAQETASIVVTTFGEDGSTPLPFVRVQVVASDGTVYGPLETPPSDASVTFTVDTGDDLSYEVAVETPPACGTAPDPVTIEQLAPGDKATVELAIPRKSGCDLGALAAYTYACPADFDASATDYPTWRDTCWEAIDGHAIRFRAGDGSGEWIKTTGQHGIPGRAPLVGLYAGTYTIEDLDASVTPVVYCLFYDSSNAIDAPAPTAIERMDVKDGLVRLKLAGDTRISCDFFYAANAPAPSEDKQPITGAETGTGSIEIHKAVCPAGYEPNPEIFNDCHGNGLEGVTFTIDGPDGFEDSAVTAIEDSPGPGIVRFTDLPAGTYTISEDVPDHDTTIYVYCSLAEAEDQVAFTYNEDGSIDLPLGEGVDVICDWYNIPVRQFEPASLTIQKFLCPDGTSSNYAAQCTEPLEAVTFDVAGTSGSVSDATDASGEVTFTDLAPGDYVVTELPPDGVHVAVYVVACSSGGKSFPFTYDDSTGLRIHVALDSGDAVTCAWYNVPPGQPAPAEGGSITIFKYLCQGKSSNDYDWFNDCQLWGEGADFALLDARGNTLATGTTDRSGQLVFSGLDDGSYGLDETSGDWCHAEADRVDSRGAVIVADAGNTDVFIFNCSAKRISTLPATGVGIPSTSAAAPSELAAAMALPALLLVVRRRRSSVGLERR
ncbi:MAG: hypothetical protein C4346_06525 [Chloroflexota bacterium]